MSKTHTGQDIYLNETFAYGNATVIEDQRSRTVKVRTKVAGKPGQWERVIELSDATGPERRSADTGTARTWSGVLPDGQAATLTAIPRKGCIPCGRR